MQKITRRQALITLGAAPVLFYTGWKGNELAADPVGEKVAPPLFPAEVGEAIAPEKVAAETAKISLPWAQQGGTINDASGLNETEVYGMVRVKTLEDIQNALRFARDNGRKVTLAGVRLSMGGHAFYKGAVVLDMTRTDEPAFLLIYAAGAAAASKKLVMRVNYRIKKGGVVNIIETGKLVDTSGIRAMIGHGYELVEGSL